MNARAPLKRAVSALVVVTATVLLVRQIALNAAEVREFAWTFDPVPLALSVLLQTGTLLAGVAAWARLLSRSNAPIGWRDLLPIWAGASLARYVPGGVWQFVVGAELGRRRGVEPSALVASLVLQTSLGAVAALAVAAMVFAPSAAPLALLAVHPRLVGLAASVVEKLTRGRVRPMVPSWPFALSQLAIMATLWVTSGVSFWLLAHAILGAPLAALPRLCAVHASAFVGGLAVVVAPSGLGVRELVLSELTQATWPVGVAAAFAAASRVWAIACEALVFLGIAAASALRRS